MLETVGHLAPHRVDVHPALVGKGRRANVGGADVVSAVCEIVNKVGEMGKLGHVADDGPIHFQLEVGNHSREIAVPDTFP